MALTNRHTMCAHRIIQFNQTHAKNQQKQQQQQNVHASKLNKSLTNAHV